MKFKFSILALACSALIGHAQTKEYTASGVLTSINASTAYTRGFTGAGSTIAILDTGIDLKSTDFTNRIILTKDFTNSGSVQDTNGHGTFVAGLAGASNNGIGIEGVAYNANLIIGKISTNGSIMDTTVINGLSWAGTNNAIVANVSAELTTNYNAKLVSPGVYTVANMTNTPNYWTKVVAENPNNWVSAMNTNPNMVLVVAAGNSGLNYTAGYGELAVATNPNGSLMFGGRVIVAGNYNVQFNMLSPSSNAAGTICLNLVNNVCQDQYKISQFYLMTPGTNIVSTAIGNGTTTMSGTSMSAPTISGAVAIIHQEWPQMTGANIVQLLLQTANKNIPHYNVNIDGQGLLDLAAATSPVGVLTIPTTGRSAVGAPLTPIMVTSGSASLSKISSIMVLDGYQRDFYVKGTSLQARMPVNEFNARQAAMPYQTHNPYTQFNNYTDYSSSKVGNFEFTAYRDVNKELSKDQSVMAEIGYTKSDLKFNIGMFTEQNTWLGNYTSNANVNSQNMTTYAGVNINHTYGTTEVYASLYNGVTGAYSHSDYITSIGPVLSYSWSLGIERHLDRNNSFGFMVYQPVAVSVSYTHLTLPTKRIV